MTSLSVAIILQLTIAHAPLSAPETVLAFASTESGMNPFVIHDNDSRRSYTLETVLEGVAPTWSLLPRSHSTDVGLLQINSANCTLTNSNIESAFDPAASVRAGAQIIIAAYQRCKLDRDKFAALRCVTSIYNTRREQVGLMNGYVARVWDIAEQVVPAIKQVTSPPVSPPSPTPCKSPPPLWDGWAVTAYQRCPRCTSFQESTKND
jgi:type IV secretion system protein VirB1